MRYDDDRWWTGGSGRVKWIDGGHFSGGQTQFISSKKQKHSVLILFVCLCLFFFRPSSVRLSSGCSQRHLTTVCQRI